MSDNRTPYQRGCDTIDEANYSCLLLLALVVVGVIAILYGLAR